MDSVIHHHIIAGDRWDLLAYRYYGDVSELGRLIDANPHLPLCETLPLGQTVFVPVIQLKATSQADLPPWLQEE